MRRRTCWIAVCLSVTYIEEGGCFNVFLLKSRYKLCILYVRRKWVPRRDIVREGDTKMFVDWDIMFVCCWFYAELHLVVYNASDITLKYMHGRVKPFFTESQKRKGYVINDVCLTRSPFISNLKYIEETKIFLQIFPKYLRLTHYKKYFLVSPVDGQWVYSNEIALKYICEL
jgi:hypothetical protein